MQKQQTMNEKKAKKVLQKAVDKMNSDQPFVEFPIQLIYEDQPGNSFVLPLERSENQSESQRGLQREKSINPRQAQFLSTYPTPVPIKNPLYEENENGQAENQEDGKSAAVPEFIIPKDFKPIKMPGSHFSMTTNK